MKKETQCVEHSFVKTLVDNSGSISMPIYQSATFEHQAVGESTGYDYARLQNPTRHELEMVLTRLEEGDDAIACSTGMAALTLIFELFEPTDAFIVGDDLYGGTVRYFDHVLAKRGNDLRVVNTSDISAIEAASDKNVKALFIETPSNPLMNVVDIRAAAELCQKHNILLIVDNTFLSPYFQNPLLLGADLVHHSGTKYLGGHNDTLAGFVVSKHPEISERLRFISKTVGACLGPFDAWLLLRGIKTLAIRMKQIEHNAFQISEFLKAHEAVKKVYYIGDPDHPSHGIQKQQSSGFGGMISFEVDTVSRCQDILKNTKLIPFAESLGGVETLLTYPITQTHADIDKAVLAARGINDRFLRLSVGIEHVDDLIADLEQALISPCT